MQVSAPHDPAIRVLVVDDHFFTRIGLTTALNFESDMGVVAEASCGHDAIELYSHHQPDVAVLDGHLPDMHGTDVAREIVRRFDRARLLIFSVEDTEEDLHRAVTAGVSGYVPKNADRSELVQAVRAVASGKRFFPKPLLGKLQERRSHVSLSDRELTVLHGMAKGWPNKAIAADMGVSAETVKTYVARILDKLAVEDRTQAVMTALDRGLIRREGLRA
jgi:DNA-binding NarL/FixJ family response regulator